MEALPDDGSFDLVISKYAFSELRSPVQLVYFDRIVSRSPRSRVLPEEPLTHEGNYIIAWGDGGSRA